MTGKPGFDFQTENLLIKANLELRMIDASLDALIFSVIVICHSNTCFFYISI